MKTSRLLITPGEPAGIGPDITVQIAQQAWPSQLIAIADPDLLTDRAKQLGLPLTIKTAKFDDAPTPHQPGTLHIIPVALSAPSQAGKLDPRNANYVIETLRIAASHCQHHRADAIITGPVQKALINEAGFAFSGHTEFFAEESGTAHTVMLFVTESLRVALATTHLPLSAVATAITPDRLRNTLTTLHRGLQTLLGIQQPRILVCGLNPHAGENGHLGREEIEIITPLLSALKAEGMNLTGPLPADTIFTPKHLQFADAILAMYHDQALPLVKYVGFGHAVNVTLGLPFIRTSVDHGTALDVAGTGLADSGSMAAAINAAINFVSKQPSLND